MPKCAIMLNKFNLPWMNLQEGKMDLVKIIKSTTRDFQFSILHEAKGMQFKFAVKDYFKGTMPDFLIGSIIGFGTDDEGELMIFVDIPYFMGKPLHGITYCSNKDQFYAEIFTVHDINSICRHFPNQDIATLEALLDEYKGKPIKRLIRGEFEAGPNNGRN